MAPREVDSNSLRGQNPKAPTRTQMPHSVWNAEFLQLRYSRGIHTAPGLPPGVCLCSPARVTPGPLPGVCPMPPPRALAVEPPASFLGSMDLHSPVPRTPLRWSFRRSQHAPCFEYGCAAALFGAPAWTTTTQLVAVRGVMIQDATASCLDFYCTTRSCQQVNHTARSCQPPQLVTWTHRDGARARNS